MQTIQSNIVILLCYVSICLSYFKSALSSLNCVNSIIVPVSQSLFSIHQSSFLFVYDTLLTLYFFFDSSYESMLIVNLCVVEVEQIIYHSDFIC